MLQRKPIALCSGLMFVAALGSAAAATPPQTFDAPVFDAAGKPAGDVRFVGQAKGGTEIVLRVTGLPPGAHGLHIHENGSCNALRDTQGKVTAFGAAGGHFDPAATGHHMGPDGAGHAGDLPMVMVDAAGIGAVTYFDPRVNVSGPNTIVGRSIVIHANADNYTDTPANGGSGDRIACGEIGAVR